MELILCKCLVVAGKNGSKPHSEDQQYPSAPALALREVTLLVLDEADRLLDLGFAEDIHAVQLLLGNQEDGGHLSAPRRWTLMFSATWTPATQSLAKRLLCGDDALHVTVGSLNLAAACSVHQRVEVLKGKGAPRFRRLCAVLGAHVGVDAVKQGLGGEATLCRDAQLSGSEMDSGSEMGDAERDDRTLAGRRAEQTVFALRLRRFHHETLAQFPPGERCAWLCPRLSLLDIAER